MVRCYANALTGLAAMANCAFAVYAASGDAHSPAVVGLAVVVALGCAGLALTLIVSFGIAAVQVTSSQTPA